MKPVKARLDSVWISAGSFGQPFDPNQGPIIIILPPGVNSVDVKFWTTHDASTSILIDGKRLFANVARTVTLSSETDQQFVAVIVHRSDDNQFQYTLGVMH